MNFRLRLNLLITGLTLASMLLGLVIVVHNARVAIATELRSASALTVQLLEATLEVLEEMEPRGAGRDYLLSKLDELGAHRHIRLELFEGSAEEKPVWTATDHSKAAAPRWFYHLVKPPMNAFQGTVPVNPEETAWVLIHPEPGDEIAEAWRGSRGLLAVLLVYALIANALVYVLLGRELLPLKQILAATDRLQQGNYHSRLPAFSTPEFDRVSRSFNGLAQTLAESSRRNHLLNRRLLEVQEDERRYLARELHDELGQCLTAIKAEAVSIGRSDQARDPAIREGAEAIASTAGKVYDMTQTLIRRLRPAALEELGLNLALRQMATDWNKRHPGMHCHCELDAGHEALEHAGHEALDSRLAIHLYRVVQECLTNVARHSGATRVSVRLGYEDGCISLQVMDDGCGFDPRAATGFGLLGMRERMEGLDGTLELLPAPGGGSLIKALVPMAAAVRMEDVNDGSLDDKPPYVAWSGTLHHPG